MALKSLTKGVSDVDEVKFLQEAAVMAQFKHPNVISLYGVVSKGQPVSFAPNSIGILCAWMPEQVGVYIQHIDNTRSG